MTQNVSSPQVQLAFQLKSIGKAQASGLLSPEQAEKQKQEAYARFGAGPSSGGMSLEDRLMLDFKAIDAAVKAGACPPERANELKVEKQREYDEKKAAIPAQGAPEAIAPLQPQFVGGGAAFNPNNADYGQQGRAEQKARLNVATAEGQAVPQDGFRPRGGPPQAPPPVQTTRHAQTAIFEQAQRNAQTTARGAAFSHAQRMFSPETVEEALSLGDALEEAVKEGIALALPAIIEQVTGTLLARFFPQAPAAVPQDTPTSNGLPPAPPSVPASHNP